MSPALPYKRIGVLMGGDSAEREISLKTGEAVLASLRRMGCSAKAIDVGPEVVETVHREKIDLAFIALHGPKGEDGTVQAILEFLGVPYTGSGVLASALGMNKLMSRRLFEASGLSVPRYRAVTRGKDLTRLAEEFGLPVVVKPNSQGSSVGVGIVDQPSNLASAMENAWRYDSEILIEEYIKGMEVHVGILGDEALGGIEVVSDTTFYDFEAKYTPGRSRHILPARLQEAVYSRTLAAGLKAHQVLGCRGYSRVDLIVDDKGTPFVLEVNTLPGMTQTSLLPEIARGAGLDFDALIQRIISMAGRNGGSGATGGAGPA